VALGYLVTICERTVPGGGVPRRPSPSLPVETAEASSQGDLRHRCSAPHCSRSKEIAAAFPAVPVLL
jgi:hypothetical protein